MAGYSQSRLIYLALLKLNAIGSGTTPTTVQTNDATDCLDDLVQTWQADGLRLWTEEDITVPLTATVDSYTIGPTGTIITPRPERVIYAQRRQISNNIDTPMEIMSRWGYNTQSSKQSPGVPVQVYPDMQIPNITLKVWPVPGTTDAADYELILTVQNPLAQITYSTSAIQFPNAWFQALKWGLASELIPEYEVTGELAALITQKAAFYKEKLEDWDQEVASVYFTLNRDRSP